LSMASTTTATPSGARPSNARSCVRTRPAPHPCNGSLGRYC
jgi:hypothetical protein